MTPINLRIKWKQIKQQVIYCILFSLVYFHKLQNNVTLSYLFYFIFVTGNVLMKECSGILYIVKLPL